MTIERPHKQTDTGLRQGHQPLCLHCAEAAGQSGHKGERRSMDLFSMISDYMQWQLTDIP